MKCEGGETMSAEAWDSLRFSFEAMDDLGELPEDAWNHLSAALRSTALEPPFH